MRRPERPDALVLVLFGLYLAACVGVLAGFCYGILRGIAVLATEPRGVQCLAAIAAVCVVLIIGVAVIARGERS